MVLVQPSRGAYPRPPLAYQGQDLSWLARRLPQTGGADAAILMPTMRRPFTLHNARFCVGNGLDGLVLTADGVAVREMAISVSQAAPRLPK